MTVCPVVLDQVITDFSPCPFCSTIGGVKVSTASGWFAARPSGTENLYRIYAESFRGKDALDTIVGEAQAIVDAALAR